MPSVLIIGASRGIGCELAQQYAADGWRVHATSRTGAPPSTLSGTKADVVMHQLDVRDPSQIAQLKKNLGAEPIDVLIVSAGTYDRVGGPFGAGPPIAPEEVFAINTDAPINIAEAVFENLTLAELGKMVFVSSAEGIRAGGRAMGPYGQSKAALNDAIRNYANEWGYYGVIGIALHPGWVRTDMGGPRGPVAPEDSAAGIKTVIANLSPAHCGAFLDYRGSNLPW
ncbi:SDR family NAD(P)-dependent oxidoreductase [Actibacterium lipolyticum]|uniref:C-factor n=1 Tax=Actibacterium lipolyticum TaxID=1524263 RepID=A0A238JYG5_9RHOB|nr:SDR family NAD(P)-dependent oxidoreductase [Actibacterium lipolyticum]SMX34746.1 C-factor [Actibacterium lipolyticum]